MQIDLAPQSAVKDVSSVRSVHPGLSANECFPRYNLQFSICNSLKRWLPSLTVGLRTPILYLITGGRTTDATTETSEEFGKLLALVAAAVSARLDLIQLREKNLKARVLYKLTARAAEITRGSATNLFVNDRADIARAGGANGVHLTTRSLEPQIIRRTFGADFLIGVSTHSLKEARAARDGGADFAVFGPVFETDSKAQYGLPLGLEKLAEVTGKLAPFPILALGGVSLENASQCLDAGASGIAAIRLFSDPARLAAAAREIRAKMHS